MASCKVTDGLIKSAEARLTTQLDSVLKELLDKEGITLSKDDFGIYTPKQIETINNYFNNHPAVESVFSREFEEGKNAGKTPIDLFFLEYYNSGGTDYKLAAKFNVKFSELTRAHINAEAAGRVGYLNANQALQARRRELGAKAITEHYSSLKSDLVGKIRDLVEILKKVVKDKSTKEMLQDAAIQENTAFYTLKNAAFAMEQILQIPEEEQKFAASVTAMTSYLVNAASIVEANNRYLKALGLNKMDLSDPNTIPSELNALRIHEIRSVTDAFKRTFFEFRPMIEELKSQDDSYSETVLGEFVAMHDKTVETILNIEDLTSKAYEAIVGKEFVKRVDQEGLLRQRKALQKKLDFAQSRKNDFVGKDDFWNKLRLKRINRQIQKLESLIGKTHVNISTIAATLRGDFGDINYLNASLVSHGINEDLIINGIGKAYREAINRVNRRLTGMYDSFGETVNEYRAKNGSVSLQDDGLKFTERRTSYYFDYATGTKQERVVIDYINEFDSQFVSDMENLKATLQELNYKIVREENVEEKLKLIEAKDVTLQEYRNLQRESGTTKYVEEYYLDQDSIEEGKRAYFKDMNAALENGDISSIVDPFKRYDELTEQINHINNNAEVVGNTKRLTPKETNAILELRREKNALSNPKYQELLKQRKLNSPPLTEKKKNEILGELLKSYNKLDKNSQEAKEADKEIGGVLNEDTYTEDSPAFDAWRQQLEEAAFTVRAATLLRERNVKMSKYHTYSMEGEFQDGKKWDGVATWKSHIEDINRREQLGEINSEVAKEQRESISTWDYDPIAVKNAADASEARNEAFTKLNKALTAQGVISAEGVILDEDVRESIYNKAGMIGQLGGLYADNKDNTAIQGIFNVVNASKHELKLLTNLYRDNSGTIQGQLMSIAEQRKVNSIDRAMAGKSSGFMSVFYNTSVDIGGTSGLYWEHKRRGLKREFILQAIAEKLNVAEAYANYSAAKEAADKLNSWTVTEEYTREINERLQEFTSKEIEEADFTGFVDAGSGNIFMRDGSIWYEISGEGKVADVVKSNFALYKDEAKVADVGKVIQHLINFKFEKFKESEWYKANHYTTIYGEESAISIWRNSVPRESVDGELVEAKKTAFRPNTRKYNKRFVDKQYLNKAKYNKTLKMHTPVKGKFLSSRYQEMKRSADKSNFKMLQAYHEMHSKASENFPDSKKLGYRISYTEKKLNFKSIEFNKGTKNVSILAKSFARQFYVTDQDIDNELGASRNPSTDTAGRKINSVPHYMSTWVEPDQVNLDLASNAFAYLAAAEEYTEMNGSYSSINKAAISVMEKHTPAIIEEEHKGLAMLAEATNKVLARTLGQDRALNQKGINNRLKVVSEMRDMYQYGLHIDNDKDYVFKEPFTGKDVSVTKLFNTLRGHKSMSVLGSVFPFGQRGYTVAREGANLANSVVQVVLNSAREERLSSFSLISFAKAWKAYFTPTGLAYDLFRDYSQARIKDKSHIGRLLDYFNVFEGNLSDHFGKLINDKNKLRLALNGDFFFLVKNAAELTNYTTIFYAWLIDNKVKVNGVDMTLLDFYQADTKDGIRPRSAEKLSIVKTDVNGEKYEHSFSSEEELYNELTHSLQRLLELTQGNYSAVSKTLIERNAIGQGLFWMKKFMPPFMVNIYGKERVDRVDNTISSGYYRTSIRILLNATLYWDWKKESWDSLSSHEKQAVKMTYRHGLVLIALTSGLMALGYDDNDEDRFKKMRDREKYIGGAAANWALYWALKSNAEASSLLLPVGAGELWKSLNTTPESMFPFMSDAIRILAKDIDWGLVPTLKKTKRDKFGWDKGSYKLFISLSNILLMRRSRGDAIETIKNWEAARNR